MRTGRKGHVARNQAIRYYSDTTILFGMDSSVLEHADVNDLYRVCNTHSVREDRSEYKPTHLRKHSSTGLGVERKKADAHLGEAMGLKYENSPTRSRIVLRIKGEVSKRVASQRGVSGYLTQASLSDRSIERGLAGLSRNPVGHHATAWNNH